MSTQKSDVLRRRYVQKKKKKKKKKKRERTERKRDDKESPKLNLGTYLTVVMTTPTQPIFKDRPNNTPPFGPHTPRSRCLKIFTLFFCSFFFCFRFKSFVSNLLLSFKFCHFDCSLFFCQRPRSFASLSFFFFFFSFFFSNSWLKKRTQKRKQRG